MRAAEPVRTQRCGDHDAAARRSDLLDAVAGVLDQLLGLESHRAIAKGPISTEIAAQQFI
jgi:hypothetical protein